MEISTLKINIGAGSKVFEGWQSVGLEDSHDIRCDVRQIPLPDDSADEAMAIHVLEHIWRWDAEKTLAEWHRVLKPGGRLVLEMPELIRCCRNIIDGFGGDQHGIKGLFGDPSGANELMMHKWCWTEAELKIALESVGFRKVKFKQPEHHGKRRNRDMRAECLK